MFNLVSDETAYSGPSLIARMWRNAPATRYWWYAAFGSPLSLQKGYAAAREPFATPCKCKIRRRQAAMDGLQAGALTAGPYSPRQG